MIYNKMKQLLLSRGAAGLTRFLITRIVRITHENIYQIESHHQNLGTQSLMLLHNWKIHRIDCLNNESKENLALLDSINHGEIEVYVSGIKEESILFAVTDLEEVIHTSFVQFKSRYKKIIHESDETPLIGNCWTNSQYRGQGLYPKTIQLAAQSLFKTGYKKVLISCATNNIPSIKGIEKAQFSQVKEIKSFIFLNKFALQLVIKKNKRRLSFIIF